MLDEIIESVSTMAVAYASPYTSVGIGPLPADNGVSVYIGSGSPSEEFMDRGKTYQIAVTCNGKHTNQHTVLQALSNIHKGLTQKLSYSSGTDWTIKNIETISVPNYVEHDISSGQWLYGSILRVTFYLKGV